MNTPRPTAKDFRLPSGWQLLKKDTAPAAVWKRKLAYARALHAWHRANESAEETEARRAEKRKKPKTRAYYARRQREAESKKAFRERTPLVERQETLDKIHACQKRHRSRLTPPRNRRSTNFYLYVTEIPSGDWTGFGVTSRGSVVERYQDRADHPSMRRKEILFLPLGDADEALMLERELKRRAEGNVEYLNKPPRAVLRTLRSIIRDRLPHRLKLFERAVRS